MRLPAGLEGQYTLEELLVSVVAVTAPNSKEPFPVPCDIGHGLFAQVTNRFHDLEGRKDCCQ